MATPYPCATAALAAYEHQLQSLPALPFLRTSGDGFGMHLRWHVPPTNDYFEACETGREYAMQFAQLLKENPLLVESNTLGRIAATIDFADKTDASGYWVGFFSHLERLVFSHAQQVDVFADLNGSEVVA